MESIVPKKPNKIVLKSITQDTNETRKGSPIFRDLIAPKSEKPTPAAVPVPVPKPRKRVNPYEISTVKSYGYPALCQVGSSKKIVDLRS